MYCKWQLYGDVSVDLNHHCLQKLLIACQIGHGEPNTNLLCSNHNRGPNTHVLRFLERHGIPYHYLPTSRGNKREAEILELVSGTDFLVLARYMQVIFRGFQLLRYVVLHIILKITETSLVVHLFCRLLSLSEIHGHDKGV